MVATIWRFRVRDVSIAAFEHAYAADGDWAQLFTRAPGYIGTELLKLHGEPGSYLTIDRWSTEADFYAAKRILEADYTALDRRCEAYTSEETWLGLHTLLD